MYSFNLLSARHLFHIKYANGLHEKDKDFFN